MSSDLEQTRWCRIQQNGLWWKKGKIAEKIWFKIFEKKKKTSEYFDYYFMGSASLGTPFHPSPKSGLGIEATLTIDFWK